MGAATSTSRLLHRVYTTRKTERSHVVKKSILVLDVMASTQVVKRKKIGISKVR